MWEVWEGEGEGSDLAVGRREIGDDWYVRLLDPAIGPTTIFFSPGPNLFPPISATMAGGQLAVGPSGRVSQWDAACFFGEYAGRGSHWPGESGVWSRMGYHGATSYQVINAARLNRATEYDWFLVWRRGHRDPQSQQSESRQHGTERESTLLCRKFVGCRSKIRTR